MQNGFSTTLCDGSSRAGKVGSETSEPMKKGPPGMAIMSAGQRAGSATALPDTTTALALAPLADGAGAREICGAEPLDATVAGGAS